MRNLASLFLVLLALANPAAAAEPQGTLRATLANGLRVVVVPDPLAPVVAVNLNYLAGSNQSPEGFPGTAHALEHMLFRGSDGLDRDQLAELSALLGGSANANTNETTTQYTTTVPAADLGLVLRAEALRMRGASITQQDWEQERGAISQEVSRNLSNPFYNLSEQVQALLFQGTPYEHNALGTRPSFDRTDAALLRRFYDSWYAPNNAILVIAGGIEPAKALALAQEAFGGIARVDVPAKPPIALKPMQARTLALPSNYSYGVVVLAFRMPALRSADYAAADVLGDVLSSDRAALYGLVPAGRALWTQVSYIPLPDVGYGMVTAAFPEGSDPAPLIQDIQQILAAVRGGAVQPELVEAAKRQELAQLAFKADSINGLAREWSRALAHGGVNSPDDISRAYEALTPADVRRLAADVLDPAHMITAVLTPQRNSAPAAAASFGEAESLLPPPDRPVVLPDWAAAALAELPPPTPVQLPVVSTLPNGLRLIVQTERVSPTVSVYGRVRQVTELQEPPGKEGVASLMGRMFQYGTELRDRLALREALDDIAASERAGPSFSLKVLSQQFEPGMRLLAEHQLRPVFPDSAFAIARTQLAQSLAGELRAPGYRSARALSEALLPKGDPALRRATPESVMTVEPADVQAYRMAAMRPEATTIVVIGDVSAEDARRVVEATFGPWQASGPAQQPELPPVGPNPASQTRVPDPTRLQDQVLIAQTVQLPVSSPDRYTLELGANILGGGSNSRLYRDLRVRTGYVYSVSGRFDWQRTRADYVVSFGADPDKVGPARTLALRNLAEMQTAPVSEAELMRAKAQILRRLAMQRASVGGIASGYLRLVELGLPLDSERIASERYRTITAVDIQRAFTEWLRPAGLAEVVTGPAP